MLLHNVPRSVTHEWHRHMERIETREQEQAILACLNRLIRIWIDHFNVLRKIEMITISMNRTADSHAT
jgi:hypothetical protein